MVLPVWAIFLINLVASIALAPRPQKPRAASIEDFDIPTAEQDRPIPVLFGTREITGPNVVWYGELGTSKIKKGSLFGSTTIGYRYFLGMHMALCHGPADAVTRIRMAEKEAWSGNITANATGTINQPELFGGKEREGGVVGDFDVLMGGDTQAPNTYLIDVLGEPMPGFRGVFSIVWKKISDTSGWLGNTPYIKPWTVTARRILQGWQGGAAWYPEAAEIGTAMNPAHIVYQCLTDTEFGMGEPVARLDDTAFRAAADALLAEGFGLNLLWNQQTQVDDFIQIVVDHIGAVLAFDRQTNQYVLKLIRGDYDPDLLPIFGPGDIVLTSLQRRAWAETVNELTLTYTDPDTHKRTSLTVQDRALFQAQQVRIAETVDLPGIDDHELAAEVAARELSNRVTPVARITFTANRKFWQHGLGQVVRIQWPRLNLPLTVFRVMNVDTGTLEAGQIRVDAVEDIYALEPRTVIIPQPADPEIPPVETPEQPPGSPNVDGKNLSGPPSNPMDGQRWFIPGDPPATGDWAGHEGQIAEWDEDGDQWLFIDVPPGVILYDEGADEYFASDGFGTIGTIEFGGSAGQVTVGGAGGYAVDKRYLWDIKTNRGTEITPSQGDLPGWIFERRIRGHGRVVNVLWDGQSAEVGSLSWQLHWFDALTGERIGGSNFGGKLVDVHRDSGARYFYGVGDEAGMGGETPIVRKIDMRAALLGNTADGISAAKFTDAGVIGFLGVARIGAILYVSVQFTPSSEHRIYRLDADTLALLDDSWAYTGSNRPGTLVTDGVELWALAADRNFGAAGEGGVPTIIPQGFAGGRWYGRANFLSDSFPAMGSDNGLEWFVEFDPTGLPSSTTPGFDSLVVGPSDLYYAKRGTQLGHSDSTNIYDGWTWTTVTDFPVHGVAGGAGFTGVRYLNSTLLAWTPRFNPGTTGCIIITSPDGEDWDEVGVSNLPVDFEIADILYDDARARWLAFGQFVDVSPDPDELRPRVYESDDLVTWALLADLAPNPATDDMRFTGAAFSGFGSNGVGAVSLRDFTSGTERAFVARTEDGGETWTFPDVYFPVTVPAGGAFSICHDGLQFLIGGRDWVGRSIDGETWSFEELLFGEAEAIGRLFTDGAGTTVGLAVSATLSRGIVTLGSDAGIVWVPTILGGDPGGVAWRINLSSGAVEIPFASPYIWANDAELVDTPQATHDYELWISFLDFGEQSARVARYRLTPLSSGSHGANMGELPGDAADQPGGSLVTLTKDGLLLSYGKVEDPRVYDLTDLGFPNPVEESPAQWTAEDPDYFRPPFQMAHDHVPDHPEPSSLDGDSAYLTIYDEVSGDVTRIPIAGAGQALLRALLTTDGDVLYRDAGTITRLPIGAAGQVLTVGSGLPSWQDVGGGGAAPAGYTVITDVDGLLDIANDLTAKYWVANDIDLSELSAWVPLTGTFTGHLAGPGVEIQNLFFDVTGQAGFFVSLGDGAVISGIRFTGVNVANDSAAYLGAIAGSLASGDAWLLDVYVSGDVDHGGNRGGGFIGINNGLLHTARCVADVTLVSAVLNHGALVGFNNATWRATLTTWNSDKTTAGWSNTAPVAFVAPAAGMPMGADFAALLSGALLKS